MDCFGDQWRTSLSECLYYGNTLADYMVHVIYPEMNRDFMDFWSLERMRVDFPGQWGTAVNFMHEYQGNWKPAALLKAARAYTGMVILHDALPSGNANGMNRPLWIGRDRFGIEADDVEFRGTGRRTAVRRARPRASTWPCGGAPAEPC